jgi:alpha-beta hydrolase superfamily lysophospholipase
MRIAGVFLLIGAAGWIVLGRLAPVALPSAGSAPADARAARALADSICGCDGEQVNPECRTRVLLPDSAASRAAASPVVVLLHGFTNCPKQFDPLARELARRGYVVIVPLLPRHGMADVMTTELCRLNAEELVRAGERSLDVARGLGGPITVVGLSSSAVVAGWLAEHRADVDCAVLIAPALGPKGMPAAMVPALTGALLHAPNFYVWWDSKLRDRNPGPRQCYPRFASRAIAEVYRLGAGVMREAARAKPKARRLVLVTTAEDDAVNNGLCADLARRWRARGARVETFQFPAAMRVHHDMIDPGQPYQRTAVVYPRLLQLIASRG